ncbi:hypothetical protein PFX98_00525 [Paucibacter sediminis]|uniref:Uncharacterized protein n=1 Tax=Paucibacter sediminis TaxID=3019553 RepID=A0AA95NFU0_9BURK|nr:hypothetical protein [Paucibacter sp. S2-9]WIT12122.1 hypothetical protein PFX98_00525 [Paucibacter sp. S2-9]
MSSNPSVKETRPPQVPYVERQNTGGKLTSIERALLAIPVASVLVACSTTGGSHESTATIGKVLEKHAASAAAVSGTYVQGSHNPLHSLVATLTAEPAHTIYVIQTANGAKRYVRERVAFDLGACVEVMTAKERVGEESWKLGEAVLRASNACGA